MNFITQVDFVIFKLFVWAFSFITWENMRPLQNHKYNYAASCTPKTSTSMEQLFCQLQKALFLRIFQAFSWLYPFFILKKPKIYMKFHKNSISCFWEKVALTNWMNGNGAFIRPPFYLEARKKGGLIKAPLP